LPNKITYRMSEVLEDKFNEVSHYDERYASYIYVCVYIHIYIYIYIYVYRKETFTEYFDYAGFLYGRETLSQTVVEI
jgi:hypothetical protein